MNDYQLLKSQLYNMKTFTVFYLISLIFQIHAETLNFKRIFQTPSRRDYDKLEILERSNFNSDDDSQSSSSSSSIPLTVNDKTKASANAQISLRFGQEKLLPCGCYRPLPQPLPPCLPPCPYPYPYPPYPTPTPYCCPYHCPHILYQYPPLSSSSSTSPVALEQLLTDVSKALATLTKTEQTAPVTAQLDNDVNQATLSSMKIEETAQVDNNVNQATLSSTKIDGTAPITAQLDNDVNQATLFEETAPLSEPIDNDDNLQSVDEVKIDNTEPEKVIIEETIIDKNGNEEEIIEIAKVLPTSKVLSEGQLVKEQLNKALVPHFSCNRADLLVTYPIVKSDNHQHFEKNYKTSGNENVYCDPIVKEPRTVLEQIESTVLPLVPSQFRKESRPLPLPFQDPAAFLPPALPEIITITKPVLLTRPQPTVVPTLQQIILPKLPHGVDCVCHCCTKYSRELNE